MTMLQIPTKSAHAHPVNPPLIVILGFSDVGKDTAFRAIESLAPLLPQPPLNIKFSEPIKTAIATYLGVPSELMEDRVWRNRVIPELGRTPLDLLVESFKHMPNIHPRLGLYKTKRTCQQCLNHPLVFTDMRNPVELDFVVNLAREYSRLIHVLFIDRPNKGALPSDKYVLPIWRECVEYEEVRTMHTRYNTGTIEEFSTDIVQLAKRFYF